MTNAPAEPVLDVADDDDDDSVTPPPDAELCPRGCPYMECYCPDGSEPRMCGHGPGGECSQGHCYACDACYCGED